MSTNNYFGCAILGMHDALVSTLGLAAGMVIAEYDNGTVLLTGVIASVAAAMSMGASQYLAYKTSYGPKDSFKYGATTGISYMLTTVALLIPFAMSVSGIYALSIMFTIGVILITLFNIVMARFCHKPFFKSWLEMITVCSLVTFAAFFVGAFAKSMLGIDI